MAISVKHKFSSLKSDGPDPTMVQPSNWNDEHQIELATNRIIGRATAGVGEAEEIVLTPYMRAVLSSENANEYQTNTGLAGFQTGDIKTTTRFVADFGWVAMRNGSIGNTGSGASELAAPEAWNLYNHLWTTVADQWCPVVGGRGATALADFNALKRIALPNTVGRMLMSASSNTGQLAGSNTATLHYTNIPAHTHSGWTGSVNRNASHSHLMPGNTYYADGGAAYAAAWGPDFNRPYQAGGTRTVAEDTNHEHYITTNGGDGLSSSPAPVSILPPHVYVTLMIKL